MKEAQFHNLFQKELQAFVSVFGNKRVTCVLIDQPCPSVRPCTYRDIGFCTISKTPKIVFVKRILELPKTNITALIRHELGHAFDPYVRKRGSEQRADDIAEYVSGERIRYDRNDLQTTGRGVYPRPLHLHR